ncbi:hypothetical protein ABZ498_23345 [Streptomyces lavendulocolor]|uniref:hypothetical protein n=1 Tax=Streptomyces lavendulocolor TaxID=67316 RepID=UPI0033F63C46
MAIVDALAEHARLNEIPLPAQEVDHEVWANRLIASLDKKKSAPASAGKVGAAEEIAIEWNLEPLRQAHMIDLVNVVTENRSKPTATWLPRVLREMLSAEMDVTEFLERAAQDSALAVVETLKELEEEFPYSVDSDPWGQHARDGENLRTVGGLLKLAARQHGEEFTPAVIVGMRRTHLGHHVDDYLAQVGTWFAPHRLVRIIDHLEKATLTNDVERLAQRIAKHRAPKRIPDAVRLLMIAEKQVAASIILRTVGDCILWRVEQVVKALLDTSAPEEILYEIALGVPYKKHDEYAKHFEESDLKGFAEIMRKAKMEIPPF